MFAKEGAKTAIVYLEEENADAERTKSLVESEGGKVLLLAGDVRDPDLGADTPLG